LNNRPKKSKKPHDALLVIDMQNDFLPGGQLAVPHADLIIPLINRYVRLMAIQDLPVIASKDWHPRNHCSFISYGGPWPEHCVKDSHGARFPASLNLCRETMVILKGTDAARDADSVFQETRLETILRTRGVERIWVCGLATDHCVLRSVKDARRAGFQVVVLIDAVRAINLSPGDGDIALAKMAAAGALFSSSTKLSLA